MSDTRKHGQQLGWNVSLARRPSFDENKPCPTGKFGHYNRAQARNSAAKIADLDDAQMNVYLCDLCDRWHCGHARIQTAGL